MEQEHITRRALELGGEHGLGLFPRDLAKAAPVPHHGPREPVGVVEALQGGVASGANAAVRNGMRRIALDLDCPPLPGAHPDATSRGALSAHRSVPRGDAGRDLLGRHDVGNQSLDVFGTASDEAGPRAAGAEDLQEISSLYAVTHPDSILVG